MLTTNIWLDYRGSTLRLLTQPATMSTVITSVCPSQRNVEDVSSILSSVIFHVYSVSNIAASSLSLCYFHVYSVSNIAASSLSLCYFHVYSVSNIAASSLSLCYFHVYSVSNIAASSLSLCYFHTHAHKLSLTADVYNQTYVPIRSNFCTLLARTSTPQAASVPVLYLSTSPQLSAEATATLPSLPLPPSQQTRNFEKTTKKRTKKTILKRDLAMLCVKRSLLTVLVMLLLLV